VNHYQPDFDRPAPPLDRPRATDLVCPVLSIGGTRTNCIGDDCLWFERRARTCTVVDSSDRLADVHRWLQVVESRLRRTL